MIAFLRGTVAESYPQRLILDVHGVGYEVIVPLSTFDRLNPLPGRELTLKTYLHVRENMQVLYGFATDAERDIFLLLIDRVSGIGPATAIAILGSLSVEQFKQAVVSGDVSGIARAKGVGKKTAERIVLELKDKVGLAATWEAQAQGSTSQAAGDAGLALIQDAAAFGFVDELHKGFAEASGVEFPHDAHVGESVIRAGEGVPRLALVLRQNDAWDVHVGEFIDVRPAEQTARSTPSIMRDMMLVAYSKRSSGLPMALLCLASSSRCA